MKVTGYYVSMISVSVINNPDKKIFVNNLVILSLINFNLFLLNTCKYVQHTLERYFVKTLLF